MITDSIITYDAEAFAGHAVRGLTPPTPDESVRASMLRQWVNHTLDDKPTRSQLRAFVETVLDERVRLYDERAALYADLEAEQKAHDGDMAQLGDERDEAVEALGSLRRHFDAVAANLQAALVERDALRRKLRERTAERDALHVDREAWRIEAVDRAVATARDQSGVTCEHGVTVRVAPRDGAS